MANVQHLSSIGGGTNGETVGTIGTKGQAKHTARIRLVTVQERRLLRDIPNFDGFVGRSRRKQARESGVEGQPRHFFIMSLDGVEVLEWRIMVMIIIRRKNGIRS